MSPPQPTELQIRKLRKRFLVMDADHDGVLELSDYEEVARRFQRNFGLAAGSRPAIAIAEVYRDLFARLLQVGDANSDGVIDENEFIITCTWSLLGRPDGFDRTLLPVLYSIMEICSLRRDDVLSENTFSALLAAEGVGPADIAVAHAHLVGPSSAFTFADLIQASRDFYCSSDPASPGNWLLGDF